MRSSLEIGIFHEFSCRQGQSEVQSFADSFDLVDAAENWGLDVIWLAELHFAPGRSVLAAPLTVASAVAARTKRIKIGTAVQVLPLTNPVRLAEEVATVDQISKGRLIFGVGRSAFPRAYEAYGIPYAESRERFTEALAILCKAWSEPVFSYQGTYHSYHQLSVTPRPYQTPYPPIRVAATSADTFPTIGTQGYPVFAAVRLGTLSELGPNIRAYRMAYQAAGHPGMGKVYLRVPVYVGPTPAEAMTEPEESIMQFYRGLGARLEDSAGGPGARDIEERANRGQRLQSVSYDEVLREKVIVGTPAMVVDRMQALQFELGLDGYLAELNCGGQIPHERVQRSLKLLCQEVLPHLR